ncbi:hypothetical protein J6590_103047, partial [Homalodisca vitripennis]
MNRAVLTVAKVILRTRETTKVQYSLSRRVPSDPDSEDVEVRVRLEENPPALKST